MKKCILSLATVLMLAASASAADMASIGLPGFKPMSNDQAMAVRGKFAIAGGGSFAVSPASASANGAFGVGVYSASQYNVSLAVSGIGGSGGFIVVGALAGGASGATGR